AWAPYDGYANADPQLCCAHALRELQAVTDAAPAGEWCWATQAAEAITAMRKLVSEAISQGRDSVGGAALAKQLSRYRSAVLIGASQTKARKDKLMKSTTRWPAGCSATRPATCGSPRTGASHRITTAANAISAWPSSGRRYPAACRPWQVPASSAPSAATCPPPPST